MKRNDPLIRAAAKVGEALDEKNPPMLPPVPQAINTVLDTIHKHDPEFPTRTYLTVLWTIVDKNGDIIYSNTNSALVWRYGDV